MQRLQAFKYELMPNGQQERQMRRFAGACRFVYNKALALQKSNHEAGGKFIGYVAMAKLLKAWRNGPETPWLKDAPVHPLQHALKDLERAYKNFFAKQARFPRFKKKGERSSFRYPDPKQIKFDGSNARIFLPKLGWLRLRLSRPVLGEIRNATVSERNWHKARRKVQRLHSRIADVRQDFLHQTSSLIASAHAMVVVEDLQVRNMSRSAAGSQDAPGRSVRAKAGLNKAILDQGWAEFRRQLEYKMQWSGGELIAVDPRNTSRTCPECGHVAADNRKTQAEFRCVACGHSAHA